MLSGNGNDVSMQMLRDGDADVMYVYADQAENLQCDSQGNSIKTEEPASWNCSLWEGFGTEYAYAQTGLFGYVYNGTTLALAKKGSGVVEKLNPCLWKFMETKEYHAICEKYDKLDSCYRNSHWTSEDNHVEHEYNLETDDHSADDCSSGYCPCPSSFAGVRRSNVSAVAGSKTRSRKRRHTRNRRTHRNKGRRRQKHGQSDMAFGVAGSDARRRKRTHTRNRRQEQGKKGKRRHHGKRNHGRMSGGMVRKQVQGLRTKDHHGRRSHRKRQNRGTLKRSRYA
jgi:hypothetical protein